MSGEAEVPGGLADSDHEEFTPVEPDQVSGLSGPVQRLDYGKPPPTPRRPPKTPSRESLALGISDEDLWMLIRRFNKQIYYVSATPDPPPQRIDLDRTEDEKYPPEKLRMTLERFYTSVIVGVVNFFNHIGRLRSWKEPRRTTAFCSVYLVAWMSDLLIFTSLGGLVALILFPRVRPVLFPAEPDHSGAQGPTHESHDSITGAPERHKGEAAEQEASQLVNSIATVAMESAAAKYGQGVPDDASEESKPETMDIVAVAEQTEPAPVDVKAKMPMKKKMSKATNQTMRVLSDISDIYERLSNLLSPTPPFYAVGQRLYLVATLLCMCPLALVPSYLIVKSLGFVIGLAFFGDPLFKGGMDFLSGNIPDWLNKWWNMPSAILNGVPTNAQLTLTLLRIGEMNSSPLPAPPSSQDDEPSWALYRNKIKSMAKKKTDPLASADLARQSTDTLPARSKLARVFRFVRRTIAVAIQSHSTIDRAIAVAGSSHTKHLLGMLHRTGGISTTFGPLKFDAKFERKRGAVVIDSSKEPPLLYFTTYQSSGLDDLRIEARKASSVLFQIPVTEILELKKTEGLGWKGKLIVELTAGSKEAADGLIISGPEDQCYQLTGMRERNQLFNRLVAIGAQFWESR